MPWGQRTKHICGRFWYCCICGSSICCVFVWIWLQFCSCDGCNVCASQSPLTSRVRVRGLTHQTTGYTSLVHGWQTRAHWDGGDGGCRLDLAGSVAGYTLRDHRGPPPTKVTHGGMDGRFDPVDAVVGVSCVSLLLPASWLPQLPHDSSCGCALSCGVVVRIPLVHGQSSQDARYKSHPPTGYIYLAGITRGRLWRWFACYTLRGQLPALRGHRGAPHAGHSVSACEV